ncbi:phosphotransferase [Corynebacterium breve]|uniref:Phosphotransferase n=1 Tax=Corynebacterium breve TaxID=3049799 RepID=A0ABY8VC96_9CORY|nr:phosphotransferase [Corynebacterium breve]WIM67108.1 phosphotransferase [Corynebacterium breve]
MELSIAEWLPQQDFYRGNRDVTPTVDVLMKVPFQSGHHYIVDCKEQGIYQFFADEQGNDIAHEASEWMKNGLDSGDPLTVGATLHGYLPEAIEVLSAPSTSKSTLNFKVRETTTGKKYMIRVFQYLLPGTADEVVLLSQLSGPHFPSILGHVSVNLNDQQYTISAVETLMEGTPGDELIRIYSAAGLYHHDQLFHLGETVRYLHDALAMAFPTEIWPSEYMAKVIMREYNELLPTHPELEQFYDHLQTLIAAMPETFPAQRVHGNLHMGRALLSDDSWAIVDFTESVPSPDTLELRSATDDMSCLASSIRFFGATNPEWCDLVMPIVLEGYGLDPHDPVFRLCQTNRGLMMWARAENDYQRRQAKRLLSFED